MFATQQIPVVSSDAGDEMALQNPNSPASLMKKSKEMEAQSEADKMYDAPPPPTVAEKFEDYFAVSCNTTNAESILKSLFLASSVLLILYAVAPQV
jgi:hypothetical protein